MGRAMINHILLTNGHVQLLDRQSATTTSALELLRKFTKKNVTRARLKYGNAPKGARTLLSFWCPLAKGCFLIN